MKSKSSPSFKGKPLVDATRPFKVTVLVEHVEAAEQGKDNACAIAKAIDSVNGEFRCQVGNSIVYVERHDRIERYGLDANVKALIRTFDRATSEDYHLFPAPYVVTLHPPLKKLRSRTGESWKKSGKRRGRYGPNTITQLTSNSPTRAMRLRLQQYQEPEG